MSRKEPLRAVKGMRDILPPESRLWGRIEKVAREVFHSYAYEEIRTPLVEVTELFARGVGEETDIVTKEMYTWEDHAWQWLPGLSKLIQVQQGPEEFHRTAKYFLELVQAASKEGIIPNSNENKTAIDVLNIKVGELNGLLSELRVSRTTDDLKEQSLRLESEIDQTIRNIKVQTLVIPFGPSLTLRPEATASVVRAYVEHKLYDPPALRKFYYMGPMFRRERPQKGRYRQFYQIGAEVFGSEGPTVDAEIIEMLIAMLGRLRLTGFSLLLNSVGCSECRPAFLEKLKQKLTVVGGSMCTDCQRRSVTNPLRVFDCKVPADQETIAQLPTITESLCEACRSHFELLQSYLNDRRIPYTLVPRMVRGLDYYTRTTFEIVHGALGAQNSLLGGGRYDGLTEQLGGPKTPGIGFSIGEDRLALAVSEANQGEQAEGMLYIAWLGQNAYRHAAELARELRTGSVMVEVAANEAKLKRSLELAQRRGASHVLIVGDQELTEGKYPLRDMARGEQKTVGKDDLFRQFGSPRGVPDLSSAEAALEERSSQ